MRTKMILPRIWIAPVLEATITHQSALITTFFCKPIHAFRNLTRTLTSASRSACASPGPLELDALLCMDDCRGPSLSRAVKGNKPGPISREGEGLMQGVEHRDALRSHWSNSLSSSSPVGPPSSTEKKQLSDKYTHLSPSAKKRRGLCKGWGTMLQSAGKAAIFRTERLRHDWGRNNNVYGGQHAFTTGEGLKLQHVQTSDFFFFFLSGRSTFAWLLYKKTLCLFSLNLFLWKTACEPAIHNIVMMMVYNS